jgi:hypothetical protein
MSMCSPCSALDKGNRDAKGHDDLDYVNGTWLTFDGKTPVKVTFFKCIDCGARWYHQNDPSNPAVGWITLN